MVRGIALGYKDQCFAPTPWTRESEEWKALDQRLAADHLARCIDRAVEMLDLGPLFDSYLGAGKKALRPDLLLKAVFYECKTIAPLQRSGLGTFGKRAPPLAALWHEAVPGAAVRFS